MNHSGGNSVLKTFPMKQTKKYKYPGNLKTEVFQKKNEHTPSFEESAKDLIDQLKEKGISVNIEESPEGRLKITLDKA